MMVTFHYVCVVCGDKEDVNIKHGGPSQHFLPERWFEVAESGPATTPLRCGDDQVCSAACLSKWFSNRTSVMASGTEALFQVWSSPLASGVVAPMSRTSEKGAGVA